MEGEVRASALIAGTTILLVEDDDAVRRLLMQVLSLNGYGVLAPESGEQALDLLADPEQPIDLLVTDVFMPGMSGKELVRRVRALRSTIRVMFVSGFPDETLARQGVPGTAFLLKPFSPAELVSAVRASLAG
jgi:DNA-binding response OmpR family regulator